MLSSDSISVSGTDHLTRRVQSRERETLARLVTPDAVELVRDYRALVETTGAVSDEEELRRYSRIIGKDLLNCIRLVVLLRGGAYEPGIEQMYRQLRRFAAELAPLADELFGLYRRPTTDREVLLRVLDRAEVQLAPTIRRPADATDD